MDSFPKVVGTSLIPEVLRFAMLPLGVFGERKTIRIPSMDGSEYTYEARREINFKIPQEMNAFLDKYHSYVSWEFQGFNERACTNALAYGSYEAIPEDGLCHAIIDELELQKSDGYTIQRKSYYNKEHSALKKVNMHPDYYNSIQARAEGYWGDFGQNDGIRTANKFIDKTAYSVASTLAVLPAGIATNAWVGTNADVAQETLGTATNISLNYDDIDTELVTRAGAKTRYTFRPHTVLFQGEHYFPLHEMTGGMMLSLRLASNENIFSTYSYKLFATGTGSAMSNAATAPTYKISNPRLVLDVITMGSEYMRVYNEYKNAMGVIKLPFEQWEVKTKSLASGQVTVAEGVNSIKGAVAYCQTLAKQNVLTNYSMSSFSALGSTGVKARFIVGGVTYPRHDMTIVDTSTTDYERISELMKAFGKLGDIGSSSLIRQEFINSEDCIFGVNFETFAQESGLFRSGIQSSGNLPLQLEIDGTATGSAMLYVLIHTDRVLTIDLDGNVAVAY
jgi:hypothetical protein